MNYIGTVRYGEMRLTDRFLARFSGLHMADKCVVRTERGVEVGDIVSPVEVLEDENSPTAGEILRKMNEQDKQRYIQIKSVDEPKEFQFCQAKIRERQLPMKLCTVEHLFGGTKLIFYFLAQGRVDFRALVKDLAQEYQARIEMRQIGVRDEARVLAHYEHCGRELCCRTFIKRLEPVTMKMAKNQKATLDPNKISGRCGRLMCCLRFEDFTYEELRRLLPRKGAKVNTKEGAGQVAGIEILDQRIKVELADGREVTLPRAEVQVLDSGTEPAPEPEPAPEVAQNVRPDSNGCNNCGQCSNGEPAPDAR